MRCSIGPAVVRSVRGSGLFPAFCTTAASESASGASTVLMLSSSARSAVICASVSASESLRASTESMICGTAAVSRSSAEGVAAVVRPPPNTPRRRSRTWSGPTVRRACSEIWNGTRNAFAEPRVWPKRSLTW